MIIVNLVKYKLKFRHTSGLCSDHSWMAVQYVCATGNIVYYEKKLSYSGPTILQFKVIRAQAIRHILTI